MVKIIVIQIYCSGTNWNSTAVWDPTFLHFVFVNRSEAAPLPSTKPLACIFPGSHTPWWSPLYAPASPKPSNCWRRLHFIRAHKNYQSGWNSAAVAIGNIKPRCGFSARQPAHLMGTNHQPPGAWICPVPAPRRRRKNRMLYRVVLNTTQNVENNSNLNYCCLYLPTN